MNIESNKYAEYLSWDSQLFGKSIGRIKFDKLGKSELLNCLEWAKSENIDCLYYLVDSSDTTFVSIAEDYGFKFIDFRFTLNAKITCEKIYSRTSVDNFEYSQSTIEDLPRLIEIVRTNHTDSRFFKDPNFDKIKSEKLFELWIMKCFNGNNSTIIISKLNSELAGYISISFTNTTGVIELIGVNDQFRNRGIGNSLIFYAFEWFKKHNIHEVNVVTQGTNIPALRMYCRCGFYPIQAKSWYHLWL